MNIEYRKATLDEAKKVCYIVQQTKAEIYPDYYTKAVIDFFGRLHSVDNIVKDIKAGRIGVLIKDGEIIGTGSHTDNHITRVYVLLNFRDKATAVVLWTSWKMKFSQNTITASLTLLFLLVSSMKTEALKR